MFAMNSSNVSTRLRAARELAELSGRALDRLAARPEGTAAIIEGRSAEGIRRHVAESYCGALGVELAWLMLGIGPCVAAAPHLDPTSPEHHDALAAHIRAAVERARSAPSAEAA
ncbi:MAG: hypothetical protein R3A48_29090 [Polyangiales bacterium]